MAPTSATNAPIHARWIPILTESAVMLPNVHKKIAAASMTASFSMLMPATSDGRLICDEPM